MEVIEDLSDDVAVLTRRILSEKGRLSTAIPEFSSRPEQLELALAIAQAISKRHTLVAEAGTGTGKTFAYLVPCLLTDKKVLISTATKTLQDQLFSKDLPTLIRALGVSKKIQNLKGRANYICHYRTALHAEEGHFVNKQNASEILLIRKRLSRLKDGVKSELPEIQEDSMVWPFVTSTTENCLGGECPNYDECFLVKARKRALESDVVVINHHLFFADSKLKDGGFGDLLPYADIIIFDEAHQLADTATSFFGERFGSRQIKELFNDTIREWPVLDLANQPLNQLILSLDKAIDALLMSFHKSDDKIEWQHCVRREAFSKAYTKLISLLEDMDACFQSQQQDDESKLSPGLKRCYLRLEQLHAQLLRLKDDVDGMIKWVERYKQSLVFNMTPSDVSEGFSQIRKTHHAAWVFTSATLTSNHSFENFNRALGLKNAETLMLPSPFDFKHQAVLYLPRGIPDTRHAQYYDVLVDVAVQLINACQGRCFFLFTSYKALNLVANTLKNRIDFPLLIQGDESKSILLNRFRTLGNAVLLGTATFWEGVDVKGRALSCVIIDKIPFSSPADPVIRGKMNHLKTLGLSPFDALALPEAILALKQGVGRLIRDKEDKGVLVIADPRLSGRSYGSEILKSLPQMTLTRENINVMNFIKDNISS